MAGLMDGEMNDWIHTYRDEVLFCQLSTAKMYNFSNNVYSICMCTWPRKRGHLFVSFKRDSADTMFDFFFFFLEWGRMEQKMGRETERRYGGLWWGVSLLNRQHCYFRVPG